MKSHSSENIPLPPRSDGTEAGYLPSSRQVTIVGANGAGKTLFMDELIKACGDKAYCLSALGADLPERSVSSRPGSIDALYAAAVVRQPYLRDNAISEIDKLSFLIFTDELEYLLSVKSEMLDVGGTTELRPTKLDQLAKLWRTIFPDSRVVRRKGTLMFSNSSGEGVIAPMRLSQGEKAVLYYIMAALYASPGAVIFIDNPSLFIHPAILNTVWNSIEELRPDCTFIYDTVDVEFVNSRTDNVCVWVKSFTADPPSWNYSVLSADQLSEDLFLDLIGSRKPVLFIEGDASHSIDSKLYTLVFSDHTVKPLGSCDKVIESTRTFNDLRTMHQLESHGIVDRDRRTEAEVDYLRRKSILVPDVAEVENIFLIESIIKTMARIRGRDPERVFAKVKRCVMNTFRHHADAQALMHTRHRVKREVECKIDAKFSCITAMETHIKSLLHLLDPRRHYNALRHEFNTMIAADDYAGVLRVFNHKPLLGDCGLPALLGYQNKDAYISGVLTALKTDSKHSRTLKAAVKHCFGLGLDQAFPTAQKKLPTHRKRSDSPSAAATRKRRSRSHKEK